MANAFEIRNQRNPSICFMQINQIQREEMVQGKEGTGTYISGWHRELVEPMEKLIAYAPVRIEGPYANYIWSVAVVAPVQEIEGNISLVYERQILLQSVMVLIILLGSVLVLLYELPLSDLDFAVLVSNHIDPENRFNKHLQLIGLFNQVF